MTAIGAIPTVPMPSDLLSAEQVVWAAPRQSVEEYKVGAQVATGTLPRKLTLHLSAVEPDGIWRSLFSTSQVVRANAAAPFIAAFASTVGTTSSILPTYAQAGAVLRTGSAAWFADAVRDLERLVALQPNWDTYGGLPTTVEHASEALAFLVENLGTRSASPSMAPIGQGGVQLDWRQGGLEVEVLFTSDDERGVYFRDLETGEEWEGDIEEARGRLQKLIPRLDVPV